MVTLTLCVLLAALSLSAPMLISHDSESFFSKRSRLNFPKPLQAVNDPQALNQPVQVGAWGDEASVGNMGVQVEIQTNAYNVSSQETDAFWVGDVLSDGAFVQFGYILPSTGYYCLNGHVTSTGTSCLSATDNIGFMDARWFWSYFPNVYAVNDWYYGFGSANSAGTNGTWHLYSIQPSASSDWNFVMDGVQVYSSNFPFTTSTSPAHLVAEKASGPYLSQLGPVEFRDLAYLGNSSLWHATSSLRLIDGCGSAASNPCTVSSAYGVELAGPNDVIAGSGVPLPESSQLVWQLQSICTLDTKLLTLGTSGSAPMNVTFIDSVSSPQGNFRTDWWFGDGSHQDGNSNKTVTYHTPGTYTPLVRVADSSGCLSEATGEVSVAATNSSALGTATASVFSFFEVGVTVYAVTPRNTYAPSG